MMQLLCHLWGDFILQNHWMANTKYKPGPWGFVACTIHVILYMLPFQLALSLTTEQYLIMFVTHWFIDRYRLAKYVQRFRNWHWKGNGTPAPDWLGVWLMFITDNIIHVTINFIALTLL